MNDKVRLLCITILSVGVSNGMEDIDIDYIDSAQTKAFGEHCAKVDNSWRTVEVSQSTSIGSLKFDNFNEFIAMAYKLVDEMYKDWGGKES
jgi:hypothetical protein